MEEKHSMKIQLSQTPTAFTDSINIACRYDGCVLLQFLSTTTDRFVENFRTMMTKDDAISFADNLASILDHYPKKAAKEKSNVTKSTKVTTKP